MELSESDYLKLKQLEESLWRGESRFDRTCMERVFSTDLFELGRSGRIYTLENLLSATGVEIADRLPLEDLLIRLNDIKVAQITYNSHVEYNGVIEKARRSSIWSFKSGRWQLRFH